MEFNPMIEASKFWTLRGNPAILSGKKLKKENAEWTHDGIKHGVISLNIGDTHLEKEVLVPQLVKEAVHQCMEQQRICYTFSEGDPRLVKSVAKRYGVPETSVFIVNGVTEGILFVGRMLGQTVGSPADCLKASKAQDNWPNVILVGPVYPPWSGLMIENGLKVGMVERHASGRMKGQPDITDMKSKINLGTKAINIIPADNPTGKVLTQETIEAVAELIKNEQEHNHEMFLIVDNIYHEFIKPDMRVDYFKIADKYNIPMIFLGGVDKTLGTGFHGGWMIIHIPKSMPQLHLQTMENMRILFAKYLGANTITQYAMMPYFNDYDRVLPDISRNLDKFHLWSNKYIKEFKPYEKELLRFKYGPPELPLYLWLELVPQNCWESATAFADDLVKTTGVLVAPGDPFGDNTCIRISVINDPIIPLNIPKIMINFIKQRISGK